MNLAIKTNEFDPHNIIISEKTKNNVMNESDFYRLIWSNEYCATNGIFIYFNLESVHIEKYFNKIKCVFANNNENQKTITYIKSIERLILNKFKNDKNKDMSRRIYEQLENGFIKLYPQSEDITYKEYSNLKFLLKISGIWSSNDNNSFGLTFRFFIINNQF